MPSFTANQYNEVKNTIIKKSLSGLNDMQQSAVTRVKGALLILAGAGSGKTTVIINRIAHILKFGCAAESSEPNDISDSDFEFLKRCAETGENLNEAADILSQDAPYPYNILAITFTNKAAGELRDRLNGMLGEDMGKEVMAGTFHSVCVRILRANIQNLGYDRDFTIYDTDDSIRIIKECLKELNLDEKRFPPRQLLTLISNAKDKLMSAEEMEKTSSESYINGVAAKVYALYAKKLKAANAVDFDDIILLTVNLFYQFPEILEKYQRRWKYIMVDEYQDTNMMQYRLIYLLAHGHGNLCVVGDDDQSIYKFRGATIENILSFEDSFSGAKVIRLEQNYRCTSKILDAANEVIKNNKQRKGKTLWTDNGEGDNIVYYKGYDEMREAAFIAKEIELNHADGAKYSDHAVLYRMNAQSNTIEQMFIRKGIPYRLIGGKKFFERKEIKDILSYLSVVNNPSDALRLKRIINEPTRGIGNVTVNNAEEIANMLGLTMFEVILNADSYPVLKTKAKVLKDFATMIIEIRNESEYCSVLDSLESVLERSGYETALLAKNDFESQGRLENINELKSTVQKYMEETEEPSLAGFLEEIALYTELDGLDENDDAVVMMTLHSAKGLEFPYVFIAGMEENIFPGMRSILNMDEIEEERRLAYVGITRAKKKLYLTSAAQRMFMGKTTRNRTSRFVTELPPQVVETRDETVHSAISRAENTRSYAPARPLSKPPMPASMQKPEPFNLSVGDRVNHYKFGDGKILAITPMGGDHMVEIAFDSGATKRLMASYIKLTKL